MKKIVILLFLIGCNFHDLVAQSPLVQSYRVNLFFGQRDLNIESFPLGPNLDFVNYMSHYDDLYVPIGIPYIGFSAHLQLRNGLELDFQAFSNDDIYPTGGKLYAQYFINDFWGFGIGAYGRPIATFGQDDFHQNRDQLEFQTWGGFELERNIYDMGWKVGPVFRYVHRGFFANLKLNFGFSGFVPISAEVLQKQIHSNFRRVIRYETSFDQQFFFFPEFRAGVELLNLRNVAIGVQMYSNYFTSRRSLNYTRTTFNWSFDIYEIEKIESPKHSYNIFNLDVGLFLRINTRE